MACISYCVWRLLCLSINARISFGIWLIVVNKSVVRCLDTLFQNCAVVAYHAWISLFFKAMTECDKLLYMWQNPVDSLFLLCRRPWVGLMMYVSAQYTRRIFRLHIMFPFGNVPAIISVASLLSIIIWPALVRFQIFAPCILYRDIWLWNISWKLFAN